MNSHYWTYTAVLASVFCACSSQIFRQEETVKTLAIAQGHSATAPYFTYDNAGKPVLCWTEQCHADSTNRLVFATYDASSGDFASPIVVTGSEGISASPESMGKIAFKGDGTIVAVFAKPFLHEKNPFAGAIYFSTSSDRGASWSSPDFLHSDTAHHYGRNFFDVARLKNGEIGAVWLDGRDKSIDGSTLYFSATVPGRGFTGETVLHRGTCECCRTDLLVDHRGILHVAYRSLMYPTALLGEQARDMAYVHSEDNGRTFSNQTAVSADNWAIRGCPHTGPTLASENGRVHALWFTAGGTPGLYYARYTSDHQRFDERRLLTTSGSHPQSIAIGSDTLMAVYEDRPTLSASHNHTTHSGAPDHTDHKTSHDTNAGSCILLHPIINGHPANPLTISSNHARNHHPVITQVDGKVLVAWVCEEGDFSTIAYKRINTDAFN